MIPSRENTQKFNYRLDNRTMCLREGGEATCTYCANYTGRSTPQNLAKHVVNEYFAVLFG